MTVDDAGRSRRAQAAFELARERLAAQDLAAAAAAYREALDLAPDVPEYVLGYAELAEAVRDWKAAARLYRHLGTLRPDCGFEGRLGCVLHNDQRFDEAAHWLLQAHHKRPDDADILINLGAALAYGGRTGDAVNAYRAAYARRPDVDILRRQLAVQVNAGGDGADDTVRDGLARHPGSDAFRTMAAEHLLKAGRYGEGFDLFAARRFEGSAAAPGAGIACPEWDGAPFDGELLVAAEQGLGDEIIASSLYHELATRGQRATIECDARLLPVLSRSLPGLSFVPRGQGHLEQRARDTAARKVRALDLCRFYRRDAAAFPARRAWLTADAARRDALRAEYRARWPGRRLAGISWKSMRHFAGEDVKSVRLVDLARTLATPDTVFVCVQYGDIGRDLEEARHAGLDVYRDERVDATRDLDALFAQIAALDVVVTTSSTTAHVAGSQGVPCLVALPGGKGVPWYWGYAGEHTPWYPSLRLFRNSERGSVAKLDAALAAAVGALPPAEAP